MTELVITDEKFLREFDKRFTFDNGKTVSILVEGQYGMCNSFDFMISEGQMVIKCFKMSDDEYIWVMLRAMEEGLI